MYAINVSEASAKIAVNAGRWCTEKNNARRNNKNKLEKLSPFRMTKPKTRTRTNAKGQRLC
jgi:hypothetical protein